MRCERERLDGTGHNRRLAMPSMALCPTSAAAASPAERRLAKPDTKVRSTRIAKLKAKDSGKPVAIQ
jgi:hypothetical protein